MLEATNYPESVPTGLLVPHYLIHCWLYYENGTPLVTDAQFDQLARRLLAEWSEAGKHPHSVAVDPEVLRTGAGAHQTAFPLRAVQAAKHYLSQALRRGWADEQVACQDWTSVEEAAARTVTRQVAIARWREQDCRP